MHGLRGLTALEPQRWAAKDCVLFLWATDPLLPKALELIEAWGFTYKTVGFYWAKTNKRADLEACRRTISLRALATGRAPTSSNACWRRADRRRAWPRMLGGLSFLRAGSTAGSPTKFMAGLNGWREDRIWRCSQGCRAEAGTLGAIKLRCLMVDTLKRETGHLIWEAVSNMR